jgi:hypothetical protein
VQPVQGAFKFSLFDPVCEEEAFDRVALRINELGALYNNATSFTEFSKIQGAAKDYVTRFLSLSPQQLCTRFVCYTVALAHLTLCDCDCVQRRMVRMHAAGQRLPGDVGGAGYRNHHALHSPGDGP